MSSNKSESRLRQCIHLSNSCGDVQDLIETLNGVTTQLANLSDDDPSREELQTFYDELVELIDLQTEEDVEEKQPSIDLSKEDSSTAYQDSSTHGLERHLAGQICSIHRWTRQGHYIRQNLVIAEVEDDFSLRVFFTNPTSIADVACEEFINSGDCRLHLSCPFSHGVIVQHADLEEKFEPEPVWYLQQNQPCLAVKHHKVKVHTNEEAFTCDTTYSDCDIHEVRLWHMARILHVDSEEGSCVVEFLTPSTRHSQYSSANDHRTVSLPIEDVLALPSSNAEDDSSDEEIEKNELDEDNLSDIDYIVLSSDVESSDGDVEDEQNQNERETLCAIKKELNFESTGFQTLSYDVNDKYINEGSICDVPGDGVAEERLGAWEEHTRGVGSRIMRLMGYAGNGGLGSRAQGRPFSVATHGNLRQIINPCRHNRHPTLDELVNNPSRNKKKRRKSQKKKRVTFSNKMGGKDPAKHQHKVFGVVDKLIHCKNAAQPNKPDSTNIELQSHRAIRQKSAKELKVELYNVEREIDKVKIKIFGAQESMKRNECKDKIMFEQSKSMLDQLEKQLKILLERKRRFNSVHSQNAKKDKLRIF